MQTLRETKSVSVNKNDTDWTKLECMYITRRNQKDMSVEKLLMIH